MKKLFLSLAVMATLTVVSCKETTEDKIEDATEAVGSDIENTMDEAGDAIDSTANKAGDDMENAVEDVKKEM
jgi:cell division protein ZapA (FtsZ GTPase activity inhibitor)